MSPERRKVLIISCVFPPEPIVSARTSLELAEELQRRGMEVAVITSFPNRPAAQLFPGWRRSGRRVQLEYSGIEVTRVATWIASSSSMLQRVLENLTFGVMASLALLVAAKPAVIYANVWPVIAGGLIGVVARIRRIPVVFAVQDLYPESLLAQKRISADHIVVKALFALDQYTTTRVERLVVISDSFAQRYVRTTGIARRAIRVIPNWIDVDGQMRNRQPFESVRRRFAIQSRSFLTIYGGNVGRASGIERVVALFCATHDDALQLIIAGNGSELDACRRHVEAAAARNVHFLTDWPESCTLAVLEQADLLVLPTAGSQAIASVPSKLLSYWLSGRPILAIADNGTEVAHAMEAAKCGWLLDPVNLDGLMAKVQEIRAIDVRERMRAGSAGRDYVRANYDRTRLCGALADDLEWLARGGIGEVYDGRGDVV